MQEESPAQLRRRYAEQYQSTSRTSPHDISLADKEVPIMASAKEDAGQVETMQQQLEAGGASKPSWRKFKLICSSTLLCFVNMAFLEQLLRLAPRASNFVSLIQHLVIISIGLYQLGGFPFGWFGSPRPAVAVRHYLPLVLLNLGSVLSSNAALTQGISIPLSMIFKSSSLVANMLLGVLLLAHRYPPGKYLAVVLVSFGLIICTLEDYRLRNAAAIPVANVSTAQVLRLPIDAATPPSGSQALGTGLLTVSLLFGAGIGIYQESLVGNFGKHPDEALLYVHLLSLPLLVAVAFTDIAHHWRLFAACLFRPCFTLADHLPLLFLLLTVASQFGCIQCVYRLATECTSLTVSLVVTNRKFLSLMFSILYFGNVFTWKHYLGSGMVFAGTLAISLIWP